MRKPGMLLLRQKALRTGERRIYLDHNSTTPLDGRIVEKMLPFMTATFGNAASRDHAFGWDAAEAVEEARSQVAGLINARTEEIIFTSGATEAVNFVLKGVRKKNFITWSAEHEAVLETSAQLASCLGIHVTQLRVDRTGQLDFGQCKELL